MRVAASADWRDAIEFETPVIVASLAPGGPARCSLCGAESELRPRTELWAVKHRHPKHHDGYVRFYCREHLPVIARPTAVDKRPARRARAERRVAARSSPLVEKTREMCPDCFIEVSATGECGMCGRRVT